MENPMSIPEACIKAASTALDKENARLHPEFPHLGEARARRVILALAENLPESAIDDACKAYAKFEGPHCICVTAMRAAIIAALKDVAGETP
jgi:hypothetical protein